MSAPGQDFMTRNMMSCSTLEPAETMGQGNPLGPSSEFGVDDNQGLGADRENDEEDACYESTCTNETTSKQKLYMPAWSTTAKQSSRRASKLNSSSRGESRRGSRVHSGGDSSSHRHRSSKTALLRRKRHAQSHRESLPESLVVDGVAAHTNTELGVRKVSKAEVLILEKEHIRALEKKGEHLQRENKALAKKTENLGKALLHFEADKYP